MVLLFEKIKMKELGNVSLLTTKITVAETRGIVWKYEGKEMMKLLILNQSLRVSSDFTILFFSTDFEV